MASCAKTYTCNCDTTTISSGKTSSMSYGINAKKADAVNKCNAGDEESQSFIKECYIK